MTALPDMPIPSRFSGRNYWIVLLLILLFALAVRIVCFVGLGFNDDSFYLEYAATLYKGLAFNPPLYIWPVRTGVYLPVVLMWKLLGISEFSTSLVFLIYSLGTVPVTCMLGSVLFNRRTGLLAAFIVSVIPLDVVYAGQIGPDVPFQLFIAVSALFFFKSVQPGTSRLLYAFLCGLFLGCAFLFKEVIFLILICFCFYPVADPRVRTKILRTERGDGCVGVLINKGIMKRLGLFFAGFLIVYCAQTGFFYNVTGQWFFAEKAKSWTIRNDGNHNDDFGFYPQAILNLNKDTFGWVHTKPLFGYVYWFVLLSALALTLQRRWSAGSLFLLCWLTVFFVFYQYGLHFVSTVILENGMRTRHSRFLLPMSVPAALLIAHAFLYKKNRSFAAVKTVLVLVLMGTSLYYAYTSKIFLRNGMGYVRETVHYLMQLEPKKMYVPDAWCLSKFLFFSGYDDEFFNRLVTYECSEVNCEDNNVKTGGFIEDAYIVTFVSPYSYLNLKQNNTYPDFVLNPPPWWKELKTITLHNHGFFSRYSPRIFYTGK